MGCDALLGREESLVREAEQKRGRMSEGSFFFSLSLSLSFAHLLEEAAGQGLQGKQCGKAACQKVCNMKSPEEAFPFRGTFSGRDRMEPRRHNSG